jgi:hypothetical protein
MQIAAREINFQVWKVYFVWRVWHPVAPSTRKVDAEFFGRFGDVLKGLLVLGFTRYLV